ncbi:tetratricopeptide repeat protein [Streptomyces sp. NBC_01506]|uniref:tetratricopeptide repeat protein n=1 Tax=Streptomyces sp. NBC_01506 TaxID=2903887 RepID=UPI00386DEA22
MQGELADIRSAALRKAGGLLREYALGAAVDAPADLADEAAEIRELYALVQRSDPRNVTAAVGLTVLALGTLQAYVENELDELFETVVEERSPFAGLADDDEAGRELADDAVHLARRALELDPANNLAAFGLGQALEWLNDHESAAAAYREALRLDPADYAAEVRVETLEDIELSRPWREEEATSHHTRGFHLLRMTELVSNSGTEVGWTWLVTDPAEVRGAAEDHLRKRVPGDDGSEGRDGRDGRDTFRLDTYLPGRPVVIADLRESLRRTPDGQVAIDWSAVAMPVLAGEPLPAGQPVRECGEMFFFGANEHVD